ncbi:MAG: glycoside hydrolase family 32 protein [Actinomycetales bacterium]
MPPELPLPLVHPRPRLGWVNDPHAGVWVDGEYHLFAQWNPASTRHENVHWAHLTSSDLLTWEEHPPALTPGTAPADPDRDGCWSGSTVRDGEAVVIVYTGYRRDETLQTICLARSDDGARTFVKDAANPVLQAPLGLDLAAFRDPFVWRDGSQWVALVGAGFADGRAAALRFTSADLTLWSYRGVFAHSRQRHLEDVDLGTVWECPQLLVEGERAVLVVSVWDVTGPDRVVAISGRLDDDGFVPDSVAPYDYGPDLYAPALARDVTGTRTLAWGWSWESRQPELASQWAGVVTLPRDVSIADGGRVRVALARETAGLRDNTLHQGLLEVDTCVVVGSCFELECRLPPGAALRLVDDDSDTDTGVGMHPPRVVVGRTGEGKLYLERPASGATAAGSAGSAGPAAQAETERYAIPGGGGDDVVRVVVDSSVVEIFAGGASLTARCLPLTDDARVVLTGQSAVGLSAWRLRLPVRGAERDPSLLPQAFEDAGLRRSAPRAT